MKHLVHKFISVIKKIFFFFRVIVTLEIGKSDREKSDNHSEGVVNDEQPNGDN